MTKADSMRRVAELHIAEARTLAFRLLACSDLIIPGEWKEPFQETVLMDVYKFAAHARHLNAIAGIDAASIGDVDASLKKIANPEVLGLVKRYDHALNYIFHAAELTISWSVWQGNKVWLSASEELIMSFLLIKKGPFRREAYFRLRHSTGISQRCRSSDKGISSGLEVLTRIMSK